MAEAGRLQQAAPAAATMLLKVMMDPATAASTKVRAVESMLNHREKALELQDIEGRLAEERSVRWIWTFPDRTPGSLNRGW